MPADGSFPTRQLRLKGLLPTKPANSKNAETDYMPLLIDTFHERFMRGLTHVPKRVAEQHF